MKFLQEKNMICISIPLLAALLWAVPSASQASIQQQPALDVGQLLASAGAQDGCSSGAACGSSSDTARDRQGNRQGNYPHDAMPSDGEPNQLDFHYAYLSTSPGGSTSGTSTSGGSSGGNNVSPLASLPAVNLSDAELIAWVASEQRFSLPMPPGNELLRPPQR